MCPIEESCSYAVECRLGLIVDCPQPMDLPDVMEVDFNDGCC